MLGTFSPFVQGLRGAAGGVRGPAGRGHPGSLMDREARHDFRRNRRLRRDAALRAEKASTPSRLTLQNTVVRPDFQRSNILARDRRAALLAPVPVGIPARFR